MDRRLLYLTLVMGLLALSGWFFNQAANANPPEGGFPIRRVSISDNEQQANDSSVNGFPSNGGRFVVFSSTASNLVPGDSNNVEDVFVRDILLGTTTLISVDNTGNLANDESSAAAITPAGDFILFNSDASDLVGGDGNGEQDGFVRDRATNTTTRVTVGEGGVEGEGASGATAISSDGRWVAFFSTADNLVPGDSNGTFDCFLRDRLHNVTVRVVPPAVPNPDGGCFLIDVTDDGRVVAFESTSSDLVPGDSNGMQDVFVMDMVNGNVRRVSVRSNGAEGDGNSHNPSLSASANGLFVAFDPDATTLVPNDSNAERDVFLHDVTTGETTVQSVSMAGTQGSAGSLEPSISQDGLRLSFYSLAPNLVANDTNGKHDVFARDLALGVTVRVSFTGNGGQGDGHSTDAAISGDGDFFAFKSEAVNLVEGDTNEFTDIFVVDGSGDSPTPTSTRTPSVTPTGTIVPPTTTPVPSVTPTGTFVPPTNTAVPSVIPTGTVIPPTATPVPSATPTGTVIPPTNTPAPSVTPTGTPGSRQVFLPLILEEPS